MALSLGYPPAARGDENDPNNESGFADLLVCRLRPWQAEHDDVSTRQRAARF
jgi:hypothetical protein